MFRLCFLSLLSCPDHSSAVDHINQVWSLAFVVFTKSYLLSYLLQPGWNPVRLDKMPDVGKIHGRFFFCMLGYVLPLFPLTNAELMCPLYVAPFTLSLQVLVAPKGEGGLGVKISSGTTRTEKSKFVSL